MGTPQGVFAISPTIDPLGDGRFYRELERRMSAVWKENPLGRIKSMQWFRRYEDLDDEAKLKARRHFEAGLSYMVIGQTVRAYVGSLLKASEDEGWSRGRVTIATRIAALVVAEPTLTNAEITRRLGCTRSYVAAVRRRGGAAS